MVYRKSLDIGSNIFIGIGNSDPEVDENFAEPLSHIDFVFN